MKKRYIVLIILFMIIIDQVTKILVSSLTNPLVLINNFLEFDYIKNDGAAFGIMGGSTILIILITLALIIYLVYDMKNNLDSKLNCISYVLIISGAIGNLIDRLFLGYVRDFISFRIFNTQMAIFNVADMFITFGIMLYIFILVRNEVYEGNKGRRRKSN